MKHFVKYDNYWWEYDPTKPKENAILMNGGVGISSGIDITGLPTQQAEDRIFLDWYGTEVYDNKYKTGWLAPSGKFYGCDYTNHSMQAKYVHHKKEEQLENEGWIKISYKITYNERTRKKELEAMFFCRDEYKYPSNEQMEYIKTHYSVEEKKEMLTYLTR